MTFQVGIDLKIGGFSYEFVGIDCRKKVSDIFVVIDKLHII